MEIKLNSFWSDRMIKTQLTQHSKTVRWQSIVTYTTIPSPRQGVIVTPCSSSLSLGANLLSGLWLSIISSHTLLKITNTCCIRCRLGSSLYHICTVGLVVYASNISSGSGSLAPDCLAPFLYYSRKKWNFYGFSRCVVSYIKTNLMIKDLEDVTWWTLFSCWMKFN